MFARLKIGALSSQLCWGRWREAPDGVWSTASASVGLRDRSDEPASDQPCFPHPIRPSATFPASRRRGNPSSREDSGDARPAHRRPLARRNGRSGRSRPDAGRHRRPVLFRQRPQCARQRLCRARGAEADAAARQSRGAAPSLFDRPLLRARVLGGEADRGAGARRRRLLALRRRRTGGAGAAARDQARAASGRSPRRSAARGGLDARARGAEPHLALFRRGRSRQPRRLPRLSLGFDRPGGGGRRRPRRSRPSGVSSGPAAPEVPARRARSSSSTARSISPTIARRSRPWPRRSPGRASRRPRST